MELKIVTLTVTYGEDHQGNLQLVQVLADGNPAPIPIYNYDTTDGESWAMIAKSLGSSICVSRELYYIKPASE